MAYPSAFASSFFKIDLDGRDVFFFWGALGNGRIVPTAADGNRLRRRLGHLSLLIAVIAIFGPAISHLVKPFGYLWLDLVASISLSVLGIATFVIYFDIWFRSRDWAIASVHRTFRESRHAFLEALGRSGIIQVGGGLALLALVGLLMIVVGDDTAFGGVYLLLGGLGVVRYLAIWHRGARG
mgnify:FL=1